MFLGFLLLWFIFNERVTVELAVIGALVSLLIDLFCRCVLGRPRRRSLRSHVRLIAGGARYALYMIGEIYRSNVSVLRLILSPGIEPEPELHTFRTSLQSDTARVILANSITITPGTITCTLEDDVFCVHALDRTFAEGFPQSETERRLKALEDMADAAE